MFIETKQVKRNKKRTVVKEYATKNNLSTRQYNKNLLELGAKTSLNEKYNLAIESEE